MKQITKNNEVNPENRSYNNRAKYHFYFSGVLHFMAISWWSPPSTPRALLLLFQGRISVLSWHNCRHFVSRIYLWPFCHSGRIRQFLSFPRNSSFSLFPRISSAFRHSRRFRRLSSLMTFCHFCRIRHHAPTSSAISSLIPFCGQFVLRESILRTDPDLEDITGARRSKTARPRAECAQSEENLSPDDVVTPAGANHMKGILPSTTRVFMTTPLDLIQIRTSYRAIPRPFSWNCSIHFLPMKSFIN